MTARARGRIKETRATRRERKDTKEKQERREQKGPLHQRKWKGAKAEVATVASHVPAVEEAVLSTELGRHEVRVERRDRRLVHARVARVARRCVVKLGRTQYSRLLERNVGVVARRSERLAGREYSTVSPRPEGASKGARTRTTDRVARPKTKLSELVSLWTSSAVKLFSSARMT